MRRFQSSLRRRRYRRRDVAERRARRPTIVWFDKPVTLPPARSSDRGKGGDALLSDLHMVTRWRRTGWVPFLDTYRTLCLPPDPSFRVVLEEVRALASPMPPPTSRRAPAG